MRATEKTHRGDAESTEFFDWFLGGEVHAHRP